jgi:hypothetical protein
MQLENGGFQRLSLPDGIGKQAKSVEALRLLHCFL